MHVIMRKLYMSIFACMLVLVTTAVTTYAWAGIFSFNTTEVFHVNLDKNPEADFSIQISLDGVNFSDSLSPVDIKRSILKNMNYSSEIDNLSDTNIEKIFEDLVLYAVSTQRKDNELGSFVYLEDITKNGFIYDFNSVESDVARKSHFEFDLYLSFKYKNDSTDSNILNETHGVYLANVDKILTGKVQTITLSNPFEFDNYFDGTVFKTVTVNSASAARVAMSIYPVVDKGEVSQYEGISPKSLTIFQGGTALPTLVNNVYSFGGMLPERDNIGFLQYNELHRPVISSSLLDDFIDNRGEEVSIESDVDSWIITKDDGLTIEKMVKIKIQMWIEGFDADCFRVIGNLPIDLNLTFASTSSEE